MRFVALLLFVAASFSGFGQYRQPGSSEIKLKLKKLNFLGSVLYVAAHPDDENTRAIAYLANERFAATGYLSMTRGDGGQNLIGPEIRDQLGLIRTQELLAARRLDGGEQFFTRANDFGFSKNYRETFEIWNKDEILSDVVRIMRQFQPDVIITRFPPDERAGHGHHTASAMLAQEAFDLISNPTAYPEQAKELGVWKSSAIYTNTGRWWNQTINEKSPNVLTLNVGSYNTLLGKSYSELAAESRTQHKSQGFGSPGRRGDAPEFFEFVKGDQPQKDIFEKVNTSWTRVAGGEKIQPLIDKAIREFDEENPAASIPLLLQIRKQINALGASIWKTRKLRETEQLIRDCAGLYVEATANSYLTSPGEKLTLSFELINRSKTSVTLQRIKSESVAMDSTLSLGLNNNELITFKSVKTVSASEEYSSPYWLREPHGLGIFTVRDKNLIGKPENDPAILLEVTFTAQGEPLTVNVPVVYKWTDPVKGELSRPLEIVPPVFINFPKQVYVFKDASPQAVSVTVKSASAGMKGNLMLELPAGWSAQPVSVPFEMKRREEEQVFTFLVTPGKEEVEGLIKAVAEINGKRFNNSLLTIQYDHIPTQTLLPPAQAKAVRLNISKEGSVVGYIKGAGDDIPASLRNLGYEVWEMKNDEVTAANLKKVDAVVLGVRALNTNERIRFFMPELLSYVKEGGTLIVQYNTSGDMEIDPDKFSPYPITLSRDRVTEEKSEVRILKPDNAVLTSPNKITSKDFEGWVQERGLYFPSAWGPEFEAPLSMNDKGEQPRNGSLLVAKYGEGHYVYTGLSFFRELPEGVPGAYKLFANLVSLHPVKKPDPVRVKAKRK